MIALVIAAVAVGSALIGFAWALCRAARSPRQSIAPEKYAYADVLMTGTIAGFDGIPIVESPWLPPGTWALVAEPEIISCGGVYASVAEAEDAIARYREAYPIVSPIALLKAKLEEDPEYLTRGSEEGS